MIGLGGAVKGGGCKKLLGVLKEKVKMVEIKLYEINVDNRGYNRPKGHKECVKQLRKLGEILPEIVLLENVEISEYDEYSSVTYGEWNIQQFLTQEQFLKLVECQLDYKVVRVITNRLDASTIFQRVGDKAEVKVVQETSQYNQKVNVHMPGQALSMYNDVMLCEDYCSDSLQQRLHEGWRIIAACPQPDQRRPDYILGRYNPAREGDGSGAERG